MTPLLEIRDLSVRFGGVQALDAVSFQVDPGELLSLIGPNGAGKTSLLRAVTGTVRVETGTIRLAGRRLDRMPTHRRMRMGLAMTHQIVRPFRAMTVMENVAFAAGRQRTRHLARALTALSRQAESDRAREILTRLEIAHVAEQPPRGQPLGILKRLEVARALALSPRLLMLDEPLAGLNSAEAAHLADTIARINREGTTVVMIEHNLGEVLRVSRRLVVLDNGRKIADGPPDAVMADPAVRMAYLGEEGAAHAAD